MGPERRPKQPKDALKPRKSGSRKGIVDMTELLPPDSPSPDAGAIEEIIQSIERAENLFGDKYKRP